MGNRREDGSLQRAYSKFDHRVLAPVRSVIRPPIRDFAIRKIEELYDIEFGTDDSESLENLQAIYDKLEANPDLNVIVASNHRCHADGPISFWTHDKIRRPQYDQGLLPNLVMPAAHWYMRFDTFRDKPKEVAFYTGNMGFMRVLFGVQTPRVVQSYQIETPPFNYSREDSNRQSVRLKSKLRRMGHADVILYPEGTRSQDGALQYGYEGISLIAMSLKPCMVVPVGHIWEDSVKRSGTSFQSHVKVRLGSPIEYDHRDKENPLSLQTMMAIAALLPPQMRGVYADAQEARQMHLDARG